MPRLAKAVAIGAAGALLRFAPPRHETEQDEIDRDFREAREAFARFIELEETCDIALLDLYSDDGVAIEHWFEKGVEKRARTIPLTRYKAQLAEALSVSAKAGEASRHYDVTLERIARGWVVVRSIREYSHAREPAPYEAVFHRELDGRWRVTREMATIIL